ncbi:AraC family transcriptional regulator [Rhizobium leguminosarum]|uniref:AraC family transcriptional regulator n=1 Tax=Rhizobium leguminosarum TaxID=384 RepID=UPI000485046E|nr:AraC family transcriptional regulator [Rhizobium leguminosarum]
MTTDALSNVLQLVEARSVISTGLRATGKWSVRVDSHTGLKFNAVLEGECLLDVDGLGSIWLETGDCFLLTQGRSFIVSSGPDVKPEAARDVFAGAVNHFAHMDRGIDGEFRSIGGRMETGSDADFLLASLPPLIVIKAGSEEARSITWLLDRLLKEIADGKPGSSVMVSQIMHMIFVELIRACPVPGGDESSWLAALSDPRIGKSLELIHGDPGRNWRLDELANACNLSRSQFSARFVALVGLAPIDYLLRWRMEVAKHALRKPGTKIARIANDLGYNSEAAFGAAFKRVHGTSPRRSASL